MRIIFIAICPVILFGQYPWPVPNMYEQHPIIGTLGEFRGFGRVLHEGVDIGEPTNHCQWSQGFNLQFLSATYPGGQTQPLLALTS